MWILEKLFPAFQHLKKFEVHVLCINPKEMPQNNMPVFRDRISLNQEKT